MIHAGKLRHKITIQQNTPTTDSRGGKVDSWATHSVIRAELTNKVGTEIIDSGKVTGSRAVTFICRYKSGITTLMRVSFDSRVFDIVDVDNVKQLNRKMVLTCIERI